MSENSFKASGAESSPQYLIEEINMIKKNKRDLRYCHTSAVENKNE